MADRYGNDVLAGDWKEPPRGRSTTHHGEIGEVVEEAVTGFCGAIVRMDRDLYTVELEDRFDKRRTFPLGPGFLLDGKPILLEAPLRAAPKKATHTASGSIAVAGASARVARGSRIYVEGRHDAELVQRVWGDDLALEGVVVEYLGGIDDLSAIVKDFAPTEERKLGVLVDHLVAGSKETRIAASIKSPHVLVVGHPFVDVWQAVKPSSIGIEAWPVIPRGIEWKHGICQAFGWPHADQADIARAWKRILAGVDTYADLEPALLGRVEELIDFVTT
ncbi:DUF3097 domain-containing protein [soil metagenome]